MVYETINNNIYNFSKKLPYVTVSAKGISNGLSTIINDGADFGPDTYLGATTKNRFGPPYTTTSGIQEAINYASQNGGKIILTSGIFGITSPITINYSGISIEGVSFGESPKINTYISVNASGIDGIDINGQYELEYITLKNLIIQFNTSSTGHGINLSSPSNIEGLTRANFENLTIHDTDSNHYGFNLTNILFLKADRLSTYNCGGGINITINGNESDLSGNSIFTETLISGFNGSSLPAINLNGNPNSNGIQLITFNRLELDSGSNGGNGNPYLNIENTTSSQFNNVVIENDLTSGTYIPVSISNSSYLTFNGLQINNASTTEQPQINISNSTWVYMNNWYNTGPPNATINMLSGSTNCEFNGNAGPFNFNGNGIKINTLAGLIPFTASGPTAGSVSGIYTTYSPSYKKILITFSGYENDTTTNQTINFPLPFSTSAVITGNNTGLTISASTSGITITAPNSTATYNGIVIVEGY